MTAPSMALADTITMLRRDVRHAVRFPMVTISGLLVPVLFLLLFDGVFGHTLRAGLGSAVSGGYINYVLPGILVMAAASVAESTALGVNADMGEGAQELLKALEGKDGKAIKDASTKLAGSCTDCHGMFR